MKPRPWAKTGKFINCIICNKSFYVPKSKVNRQKYCSKNCFDKSDRTYSKGENNYQWKKNPGYFTIHAWLVRIFGKANKCENPDCLKLSTIYHWAKIKGKKHERKRENYWMLCTLCHRKYDWLPEWNKNMSLAHKGKPLSFEQRSKMKGQHRSPATEFKKGSKWTPELREKIMKARETNKQKHLFNT